MVSIDATGLAVVYTVVFCQFYTQGLFRQVIGTEQKTWEQMATSCN